MCRNRHFSPEKLIADIRAARERYGRCVVAMSEGVQTEDGTPLAESLIPEERKERDDHGNLQLSGGDLGLALQAAMTAAFPKVRARVDTFGYLPRGFAGMISDVDRREAFDIGRYAVEAADQGSGSVAMQYADGRIALKLVPLAAVAGKTQHMPKDFIAPSGNDITDGVPGLSRPAGAAAARGLDAVRLGRWPAATGRSGRPGRASLRSGRRRSDGRSLPTRVMPRRSINAKLVRSTSEKSWSG